MTTEPEWERPDPWVGALERGAALLGVLSAGGLRPHSTLVVECGREHCRIVGDFSDRDRLVNLDIQVAL